MALWVQISPGSGDPIYVQIVEQIAEAIAMGELAAGDKLPSVRKLAAKLVINPNTVARAYRVLEQAGLVNTKTGSGTFIGGPKLRSGDEADINILAERMDTLLAQGLNLGLEARDLIAMFKGRIGRFVNKKTSGKKK
jgi:GntR family transcriptional regulator